jgi:DNA-binding LacI/PurR family transcriptional regulator
MSNTRVTIYDIAREAEVSVATVSRILTGSAPVRPDTKERVEAVLHKYNFRPNRLARNLSYQRTRTIGVILPDITNPYFSTVFAELQRDALARDYSLLLFNAMNSLDLESEGLAYLSRHQVDGLIFMGGRVDEITLADKYRQELESFAEQIPTTVVNGGYVSDFISTVHTDEMDGIAQLVEYLTGLGHQHIGLLGGSDHITVTRDRQRAFRETMARAGHEVRDEWMITDGFSIESGVRALDTLLQLPAHPTAIVCINDLVALGVLKAARRHRASVPRDLSIAGFDDVYLAEVATPELTTVSHNYPALGAAVIETMVRHIEGESIPEAVQIAMTLVVRSSCGPARE